MRVGLKGQLSMVIILVVIMIFIGLILLLFSFAGSIERGDYMNTYAHSLLLSSLRSTLYTDRGSAYTDNECRSVSDVIACSFLQMSDYRCAGTTTRCSDLVVPGIKDSINSAIKPGMIYLITINPPYQPGRPIEIGEASLKDAKKEKWAAEERIVRIAGSSQFIIKVGILVSQI